MFSVAFGTYSARKNEFGQYVRSRWSVTYSINVDIHGLLHDIPRSFKLFLRHFLPLTKDRKCKVCLPFCVIKFRTGCHSYCFAFLTVGYAFFRCRYLSYKLFLISPLSNRIKINYINIQKIMLFDKISE